MFHTTTRCDTDVLGTRFRATTARTFRTSVLPQLFGHRQSSRRLISKCVSLHDKIYFFDVSISKSPPRMKRFFQCDFEARFHMFNFERCLVPQRAHFFDRNFQNCSDHLVFGTVDFKTRFRPEWRASVHPSSCQIAPHPPKFPSLKWTNVPNISNRKFGASTKEVKHGRNYGSKTSHVGLSRGSDKDPENLETRTSYRHPREEKDKNYQPTWTASKTFMQGFLENKSRRSPQDLLARTCAGSCTDTDGIAPGPLQQFRTRQNHTKTYKNLWL